jgi:peptidoglycan/LPS O-acetylase OafA/YrhL
MKVSAELSEEVGGSSTKGMRSEGMIPGLDGLRAVAVIMVMLFHQHILEFGWAGVQLFFVLSGFLITAVLYRQKGAHLGPYIQRFYWRRFLRIFPVYYAYLALLSLLIAVRLVPKDVSSHLPYAFAYLYDFVYAQGVLTPSKTISHFWSLSVEEQFYLVWPFVIFFCTKRTLEWVLWAIVVTGPLIRYLT